MHDFRKSVERFPRKKCPTLALPSAAQIAVSACSQIADQEYFCAARAVYKLGSPALLFAAGELFQAATLGFREIRIAVLVVVLFILIVVGRGEVVLRNGDAGLGGDNVR